MEKMLEILSKQNELQSNLNGIKETIDKRLEAEIRVQMDARQTDAIKFFSKVNPRLHFRTSLQLRQPMTGLWLVDGEHFLAWKSTPNSKLWLTGIPGAGKTVLCGAAIESILQDSKESIAVAYFFCDYKNQESQRAEVIFGSLATQIALQSPHAMGYLQEYYDELNPKGEFGRQAEVEELISIIQHMAGHFEKVYIVVDALDECGHEAWSTADALKTLAEGTYTINMALFSREEEDIRDSLADDFSRIEIAAQTGDLELYVRAKMSRKKNLKELYVRNPQLNREIRNHLIRGAKGM